MFDFNDCTVGTINQTNKTVRRTRKHNKKLIRYNRS